MRSPPFCPNPHCPNHQHPPSRHWFWQANHYDTRTFGSVQRFSCLTCSHRFSTQSFSIDYYAKRKLDYRSVANRISRLARNALAAHCRLIGMAVDEEDLVGKYSQYLYFANYCTLRRKGRMTDTQK